MTQPTTSTNRRNVLRTLAAASAATALPVGSALAAENGLQAHYSFDDGTATDDTGNGFDGTVNGATATTSGTSGNCLEFDGVGDVVDVPNTVEGQRSVTISAWVNPDSLGTDAAVIGDYAQHTNFLLWYDDGADAWTANFNAASGGSNHAVSGGNPSAGIWTHLAAVFDGRTQVLRLYVDGTEVDSTSCETATNPSTGGLQIGSDFGGHGYWDGRIDEVRIYQNALDSAAVAVDAIDDRLAAYYPMDGSTATDETGNGNDGTISGATPGAEGVTKRCLGFDGVDDVVDVPNTVEGQQTASISLWVRTDSLDRDRAIVGDYSQHSNFVVWYKHSAAVWKANFNGGGGANNAVSGGSPTTGRWTHLVTVFDGANQTLRLYVDGVEVDATACDAATNSATNDLQIGSDFGGHGYWDGRIDEVRIYQHALAASEVDALYDDRAPLFDLQFQGRVFRPSDLDYNPRDEFIFPSVIETSNLTNPLGAYHMYYAPHDIPGGICLLYADSLDGPWTEYANNPVISRTWSPHYDVDHVSSPDAFWHDENDQLYLYFHGGNAYTRYATSSDGVSFSYGDVAISIYDMQNSINASYARVYEHAIPGRSNQYVMFFMDNQNDTRHVRLATSNDAENWTIDPDEVITPASQHDGDVAGPYFLPWNDRYFLLYHSASDYMHVTEVGEAIDEENHVGTFHAPMDGAPDDGRSATPYLIRDGNTMYVFYTSGQGHDTTIAYETTDR